MKHRFVSGTRLVSPLMRLFYQLFNGTSPYGWAAYHIVPERRGTLWIHCHGSRWRGGVKLEFTGVPPELRGEAIALMFALLRLTRSGRRFHADEDFAERFSARGQRFAQIGTFRSTGRNDRQHAGTLRVVDYHQPLVDGFPRRLFAAHAVARADAATDPARREALYRQALEIFPGEYGEFGEGAEIDPVDGDLTELQNRFNVFAWYGLAELLRDQGRAADAFAVLADAIAHCPGWAEAYRRGLLQSGGPEDQYFRFWRDADVNEIAIRHRPAVAAATAPAQAPGFGSRPAEASAGFGRRPADPMAELLKRG